MIYFPSISCPISHLVSSCSLLLILLLTSSPSVTLLRLRQTSNEEPDYSVAEVRSVTFALTIEVYSVVLTWSRIKKVGRSKPRGLDTPLIRRVLVHLKAWHSSGRHQPEPTRQCTGDPHEIRARLDPGVGRQAVSTAKRFPLTALSNNFGSLIGLLSKPPGSEESRRRIFRCIPGTWTNGIGQSAVCL